MQCRRIDDVLNDHMKATIDGLRECACSECVLQEFRAVIYRHKTITRFGHNILRSTAHECNTNELVFILMKHTPESNRSRVKWLVQSLIRTIAIYTDSFE